MPVRIDRDGHRYSAEKILVREGVAIGDTVASTHNEGGSETTAQ